MNILSQMERFKPLFFLTTKYLHIILLWLENQEIKKWPIKLNRSHYVSILPSTNLLTHSNICDLDIETSPIHQLKRVENIRDTFIYFFTKIWILRTITFHSSSVHDCNTCSFTKFLDGNKKTQPIDAMANNSDRKIMMHIQLQNPSQCCHLLRKKTKHYPGT